MPMAGDDPAAISVASALVRDVGYEPVLVGTLAGMGSLTKTNSGTLTVLTLNDYTGRTVIAGGVLEAGTIDLAGTPSALGAAGNNPSNLVVSGGTLRSLAAMAATDRGATLNSSGATLDVPLGKGDPVIQLGHAIAGRDRCLVILDNFEQVAALAESTVGHWVSRARDGQGSPA